MRWPLRWKLLLSYLVIIAIVLVSGMTYLHLILSAQLMEQTAGSLTRSAHLARQHIQSYPRGGGLPSPDFLADAIGRSLGVRVTIVASDGRVLGDSELTPEEISRVDNHGTRPEILASRQKGIGQSVRFSKTVKRKMLYLAIPLQKGVLQGGTLRLAISLDQVEETVAKMRRLLLAAGGFAFLIAIGLSLGVVHVAQRAFREIMNAVGAISQGIFTHRIESRRGDELGELARAMDRMTEELQKSLDALRSERDQLEAILEGMTEGVMVTNARGEILIANDAFRRLFPSLPSSGEVFPLEAIRENQVQEAIGEALQISDGAFEREVELVGPPRRVVSLHAARSGFGEMENLVIVFHDLSEIKELEKIRQDFTANVSHELRTPLTAIRTAAETIRKAAREDPEAAGRFASAIERQSLRLSALVEDLLELGRIESKEDHLRLEEVSLKNSANTAARMLENVIQESGVRIEIDVADKDDRVMADGAALERIFLNLLENAVHYAPEDSPVRISARAVESGKIEVSVADRGEGIPAAHHARIFERFYRVDPARSRERGGTGLGLAIVKHLVQGHGGSIRVESPPGEGATFRFTMDSA